MKKSQQITFWLSPEEAVKLKKYANTVGLSRSAYIRRAALKKPIALKPASCQMQIKPLLSRLGDEITGLASMIGDAETLRLRAAVYEAYNMCNGVNVDGL